MTPQNDRRHAPRERRVGVRQQIQRREVSWRRAIRLLVVPLIVVFACVGVIATGDAALHSDVSHLRDRVRALEHPALERGVPVLQPLGHTHY